MRSRHTSSVFASAATLAVAAMAAACIGSATPVHAAMIASDNAANYTSFGTTPSPTNGGTGFGAWNIQLTNDNSPPYAGSFLGNNASVNIASSSGAYWGFYANSGTSTTIPSVNAYRQFENSSGTGVGTLRQNQQFDAALEVQSGNNGLGANTGVAAGFSLDTVSNGTYTPVFTLAFAQTPGANNNYPVVTTITDANGSTTYTSQAYNSPGTNAIDESQLEAGINASFALGADGAYTLTLAPANGNTLLTSPLVYTGTVSGSINAADIFDSATNANLQVNNLAVAATPEPASIALLAVAAGGLLLTRRKKLL
jgi:hypothetical protein